MCALLVPFPSLLLTQMKCWAQLYGEDSLQSPTSVKEVMDFMGPNGLRMQPFWGAPFFHSVFQTAGPFIMYPLNLANIKKIVEDWREKEMALVELVWNFFLWFSSSNLPSLFTIFLELWRGRSIKEQSAFFACGVTLTAIPSNVHTLPGTDIVGTRPHVGRRSGRCFPEYLFGIALQ